MEVTKSDTGKAEEVGAEAGIEIRVHARGAKAAEGIKTRQNDMPAEVEADPEAGRIELIVIVS